MIFDGQQYKSRPELGWRYAREGEVYTDGDQIPTNYVVVYRVKDVEHFEIAGQPFYEPAHVAKDQLLPLDTHFGTGVAVSATRREKGRFVNTVYLVKDNRVYTRALRRDM